MFNQYSQFFLVYKWLDIIEILIISTIFYAFSVWLKKDKQKNLIFTFYLLNVVLVFTNITGMQIVYNLLFNFYPIFLILFILVHQNTLQKSFVSFYKLKPKEVNQSWVENFMRLCLNVINNNKNIQVIIQSKEDISPFINTNFFIRSHFNPNLLTAVLQSSDFDYDKFILINNDGYIEAVNCESSFDKELLWVEKENKLEEWKQEAILLTNKFESLIFKTDFKTRSFNIILNGKLFENILHNNATNIINQFIKKNQLNKEQNEAINIRTKNVDQQQCN